MAIRDTMVQGGGLRVEGGGDVGGRCAAARFEFSTNYINAVKSMPFKRRRRPPPLHPPPSTLHPVVDRDSRPPVPTPVAVARQRFVGTMLDAKQRREWHGEPLLGQSGGEPEIVWRIGEGDVVCVDAEAAHEVEGVGAMNDG